ncbi:uroporphyrinogen-III synthase [Alkalihalophilus marmarensis]|jgi:uroporphyrinogen-III synthase|uniref:Uroporphyrinogen-III synthase n=1 Tax=Alkalihalophilus marmarensis DSM 21297 TaxID=1188261 RepID=U6SL42_9BACI|nr:uroporphyrinogen-III synthase [Alkalihalophilus marmarensis]ERN52434.1 hypothetical protein A33I_15545 [Alkalihalophilus marmarensis DSM 21297]MCM3487935.1 uroporphyrinogen-III synthase [Alkalihalophilus marmarensis]
MATNALSGKHVLVTRAKDQAEPFINRIEEAGGISHVIPLLLFQPVKSDQLEKAITYINEFDWLVFTSANGVRFFLEELKKRHLPSSLKARIAVVGEKTEAVLDEYGLKADLLPDRYVAENLVVALTTHITAGEKILMPRGNLGRTLLPIELEKAGIEVSDLTIYETVCPPEAKDQFRAFIKSGQAIDVITFTSSSAVRHFAQVLHELKIEKPFKDAKIACIGPIAEKTATEFHLSVDITASTYTIEGLIEAIITYYKEAKKV